MLVSMFAWKNHILILWKSVKKSKNIYVDRGGVVHKNSGTDVGRGLVGVFWRPYRFFPCDCKFFPWAIFIWSKLNNAPIWHVHLDTCPEFIILLQSSPLILTQTRTTDRDGASCRSKTLILTHRWLIALICANRTLIEQTKVSISGSTFQIFKCFKRRWR